MEVLAHQENVFHLIERGKYPALFGLLCLCGLGLPLPEDIPLIAAGILVQQGQMNLAMAAICAWCGIIGGDCILYTLGRKFGPDIVRVPIIGSHISLTRMAKVEKWFDRWGVWVVGICRMFAGVRGAMVVVAGATKFKFWKFIIADGLAAIISGGMFVFLGYKFGQHRKQLERLVHEVKGGIAIACALLAAVLLYVYLRQREARRAEQARGFEPLPPNPVPTEPAVDRADPTPP